MKYIYFLRPNINNNQISRNLTHEIDLFDVHAFLTLNIIIFCVDNIQNYYSWRSSLLNV